MESNCVSKALLTPEALISWKKERGLLQIPVPPKTIILTTHSSLIESKQKFFGNKWLRGLIGKHLCIDKDSGTYLSTGWGIGSPAMIATCEELRVLGATTFFLVGIAGRLTDDIQEGEMVMANAALSEEGTSRHYFGKSNQQIPCSEKIITQLSEVKSCKFVSTDAPYRETPEVVSQWRKEGAAMVDMETSALYTFANYYGCNACSIALGGDALSNDSWRMVSDLHALYKKQIEVLDVVLKIAKA